MTNVFIDTNLFIYLNTPSADFDRYAAFYEDEIMDNHAFTNVIVIDELLYVSKKKYNIPYTTTIEFIDSTVIPCVDILNVDLRTYTTMKEVLKYCSKPSDALIAATMKNSSVGIILSEDGGFDRIPFVQRKWIHR